MWPYTSVVLFLPFAPVVFFGLLEEDFGCSPIQRRRRLVQKDTCLRDEREANTTVVVFQAFA